MARQRSNQGQDVLSNKRLASCEADSCDALFDKDGANAVEFLQCENILPWREGYVLLQAIKAAEIAPICDGNAKVGDGAPERIIIVKLSGAR